MTLKHLKAGLINESLVMPYVKNQYLASLSIYQNLLLVLGWNGLENFVKGTMDIYRNKYREIYMEYGWKW